MEKQIETVVDGSLPNLAYYSVEQQGKYVFLTIGAQGEHGSANCFTKKSLVELATFILELSTKLPES